MKTTKKHVISRLLRPKAEKEKEPILEPGHPKDDPSLKSAPSDNQNSSPTPEAPHKSEGFTCPNEKCGKIILEPLKMTDLSKTPKETFYVCPHCMSKLDITTAEQKSTPNPVSIEKPLPVDNAGANKKAGPKKCPHYLGYLKERPKNTPIPNECLTCPETIKCLLG